jgi:predicted phosphoadenosine phosphosulfate sulfurtransferase
MNRIPCPRSTAAAVPLFRSRAFRRPGAGSFTRIGELEVNRGKRMAKRTYKEGTNVFDAAYERMAFVFDRFERVYVSFSGGKDSGVLLNLALKFMRENGIKRKLGVQILDNEANYEYSVQFMRRMIEANRDMLEVYWCCMPITLPCTVSSYQVDWQCWGVQDQARWVRPMPEGDYVVNYDNHPFGDWFVENMPYDRFWDGFAEWYSQGKTCANLVGIRTDESLNRFRAILNDAKETMEGRQWTKKNTEHAYNCYPIYDWRTRDVWIANARHEWDYNKLYDVFYMAGVPVGKMRVASPFMSESKSSLNLYRVIDPHTWARLCARVQGANFIATYGKQLNYTSFKLPPGHTWKSFVKFLLDTLPKEPQENFKRRFVQSIKFWGRVGRGLRDEVIEELRQLGVRFEINGTTPHGGNDLKRVRIRRPPDHVDGLSGEHSSVTSWKRFALTILKNDHTCKYLGLAPTLEQAKRQRQIVEKYRNVK